MIHNPVRENRSVREALIEPPAIHQKITIMERNREQQIKSLNNIISTLQNEKRYDLYNDIMNLMQLSIDLKEG